MAINHSDCEHPSTSGARAKCRRGQATGASPKDIDFTSTPRAKKETEPYGAFNSRTPRDKDRQCVTCGVERIKWRGTEFTTGLLLYVCDRCKWRISTAEDLAAAE